MSDVDVAALRKALDQATLGPWSYGANTIWDVSDSLPIAEMESGDCDQRENAELIVLLRNNAEALLNALEQAQATVAEQSMEIAHLAWLGERAAERAEAQIAALTREVERAQAASEGVDMLVAQAEQRGYEAARKRCCVNAKFDETDYSALFEDDE